MCTVCKSNTPPLSSLVRGIDPLKMILLTGGYLLFPSCVTPVHCSKLLHDDLKHPDVVKALEHWTGKNRLSEDEADDLMEDNYR